MINSQRLQRQTFLGATSERTLSDLQVGVVGLGGGGSHIAQQLAHVGVGNLLFVDHDRVEESNLNRMVGATHSDARNGELKVRVARRLARRISPSTKVRIEASTWQECAERLRDCHVVFGCVDSFSGRDELERTCRRYQLPYIDIGMDVHERSGSYAITGQVALSMPTRACLHCMGVLTPPLLAEEARRYGEAGDRPQVIWPNGILASSAVGLMIQLVTPWHEEHANTLLLEYDGNTAELKRSTASDILNGLTCSHFARPADLGDPWFGIHS